jgi:hypothetical protein
MSLSLATAKINLAPEIYQNSQRDKRHRKIALTLGTIISVVALGVVIAAGVLLTAQTVAIRLLRQSVTSDENQLQTYPNLIKAATAGDCHFQPSARSAERSADYRYRPELRPGLRVCPGAEC